MLALIILCILCILLTWLLCAAVCIGIGFLLLKGLRFNCSMMEALWTGLALITAILQLYHFFSPIDIVAVFLLLGLGLAGWILNFAVRNADGSAGSAWLLQDWEERKKSWLAEHLVDGFQDWCNSLRPPAVDEPVRTVRVSVRRLDDVLAELEVSKGDFIKLDVEGAELSVLYGAMKLLRMESRPAILAEVQDTRTQPWGYAVREIIQFLIRMDYRWFAIAAKGALLPISCDQETYNANLVALPVERTEEFLGLLGQK